jgi:hypothetical protein
VADVRVTVADVSVAVVDVAVLVAYVRVTVADVPVAVVDVVRDDVAATVLIAICVLKPGSPSTRVHTLT